MDTVANTSKAKRRQLLPEEWEDEVSFLNEAKRKYISQRDFYSERDLFDYLREEIAEMQGFFSWLDFTTLNLERVIDACGYYLIHAGKEEEEKEKLSNELKELISFNTSLVGYRDVIAVKAYYYEDMLNKVDELNQQRKDEAD